MGHPIPKYYRTQLDYSATCLAKSGFTKKHFDITFNNEILTSTNQLTLIYNEKYRYSQSRLAYRRHLRQSHRADFCPNNESSDKDINSARSSQKGSGLPRGSRIDGNHILLFRVPEMVSVRGAGASWFLGVSEWLFGALFWNKKLGILGALGSCVTFIMTITIIPFMPDGWNASAGGFPAMQGNVAFLMKDVVLFAVSFYC
jgi:Protein of unknown function, DUF417